MLSDEQILQTALTIAQAQSVQVGDVVAHPSDKTAYTLLEIQENLGIVGYKKTRKEFPLDELFDPNVAKAEAVRIVSEQTQEELNKYLGINRNN